MSSIHTRLILVTALVTGVAATHASDSQIDVENHVTHGPILGGLTPTAVSVWARTARAGRVAVRYGTNRIHLDQSTEPVLTAIEHDNTGVVRIAELTPDTKYYYELMMPDVVGVTGQTGSFITMPDSNDFTDPVLNPRGLFNFSFEFACGNNQNPGPSNGPELPAFTTMLDMLRDRIHFAILNGDWLYESQRQYTPDQWKNQVGPTDAQLPHPVNVAPTIVGVWQNYKHFLDQGANLAKWHRHIPSFFTYDDHEILNDVWGAGTPGLRDRRAVFRDIGVRAWYDYLGWSNPTSFAQRIRFGHAELTAGHAELFDPKADFSTLDLKQANNLHVHWGTATAGVNDNALDGVGGDPNAGVYRIVRIIDANRLEIDPPPRANTAISYSIGRRSYYRMRIANCEFFVLDTRGQRQMHDTGEPDKPGLSMLGPVQRDWLMDGISQSDADFIFVVSSVNFMVPHVGGGQVRTTNKDDAWTVFFDEREMLINFWDKLQKPVMLLTGDLHNSFVIQVTDNVWEFASGPHNSHNHLNSDEGNRPPNGPFKYGPREVDVRWSTWYRHDIPRDQLKHPTFCVVQVNNAIDNPTEPGRHRWVAYPRPQAVFQYYDGRTGELRYAESVLAAPRAP